MSQNEGDSKIPPESLELSPMYFVVLRTIWKRISHIVRNDRL